MDRSYRRFSIGVKNVIACCKDVITLNDALVFAHDYKYSIDFETKKAVREQLVVNITVSHGTVNSIFRLGRDYYIRFPKLKEYGVSILKEYKVLPYLSKKITIAIPYMSYNIPSTLYGLNVIGKNLEKIWKKFCSLFSAE